MNTDYIDVWNQALTNPGGIRITLGNKRQAYYIRKQLHVTRRSAQAESRNLYAADHPSYNTSHWDHLIVSITDTFDVIIKPPPKLKVEKL